MARMVSGYTPAKLITGGQVGADSIAFRVHDELGIPLDGSLPSGLRRDDGKGAEIQEKYHLKESKGGFKSRDIENAQISDACVGFLCTKELTGKGTMQTLNVFVNDAYEFEKLEKPKTKNFLVIQGKRPVIVFWNVAEDTVEGMADELAKFLNEFRPKNLMISGSTESVWPGVEEHGAKLMMSAFKKNGYHKPADCETTQNSP